MIQQVIPGEESQFSYTALCQDVRGLHHLLQTDPAIPMDLGVPVHLFNGRRPITSATAVRLIEALRYTGMSGS